MDSSNPVADSTRMTIASMRGKSERIARQNLAALERVLKGKQRCVFEEYPDASNLEDGWDLATTNAVKSIRTTWLAKIKEASQTDLDLSEVCNSIAPISVSGLLVDGIAVHPPGVNDKGGKVANNLTFGGVSIDGRVAQALAQRLGPGAVGGLLKEVPPYTRGTQKGFKSRCLQQLGKKCVQISSGRSKREFFELMDKRLPVEWDKLPNWGDEINSQVDLLKTSFQSSAGAPYWRTKLDSIELLQKHILPLIVDAIQNDGLDKLFKEQPELWLSVLKNKEDRYADPTKKTRPYLSLPWHWQALFSCLSQPYCKNMYLFHNKPGCRNAYGFSYAHGGGNEIILHIKEALKKDGDVTYFVYGDDVDFYYRKGGSVYRVCADFKQMDGSVDATTIDWTIDYIISQYERKYGNTYSNFWKAVAEEWKMFATQPLMVVDGTNIFQKKTRDGLMTGVVGTTLFDTVKSVVAYEEFVQALQHHPSLLKEERAVKFFLERGLVIKEGTWYSEEVNMNPQPGELLTNQKFLGMQLLCVEFEGLPLMVPTLPEKDWYHMLLTPKREEARKSISRTALDRYLFDRMRGLLTTGAVFNRNIRLMLNAILRDIDSCAIVMQVQACDGKGASPEFVNVVGDEFRFSTSMGWPTEEWAMNLYAPEKWKTGAPMASIFECGEEPFRQAYSRPEIKLEACVVDVSTPMGVEASMVLAGDKTKDDPPPIEASLMPTQVSTCKHESPNKRSKLVDLENPEKVVKTKPTLRSSIRTLMQPQPLASARIMMKLLEVYLETGQLEPTVKDMLLRPDIMLQMLRFLAEFAPTTLFEDWWGQLTRHMIWPVHEISGILGVNPQRLERVARELGYYVVGPSSNRWLVGVPLAGVNEQVRSQVARQEKENVRNLAEVRKEIKTTTVEKVSELKMQEKTLQATITRSQQQPAVVMVEEGKRKMPSFKKVPNLEIPTELPPDRLRLYASDILHHNRMTARRQEDRDSTGWTHSFYINDKLVLLLYKYSGKQSWIYFYQHVINAYLKDTTMPQKNENWADAAAREQAANVRIFKTSAGPILLQAAKDVPVELLQSHPKLMTILQPQGKRVAVQFAGQVYDLTLKNGTIKERVKRLEKFLGEPVTYEYAPLNELAERYQIIANYYGRQSKSNQRRQERSRSNGGRKVIHIQGPIPETQETPRPKTSENVRHSSSGERQRLFRDHHHEVERCHGSPQRASCHHSSCVERDPSVQRGATLAAMAARFFADRSRQQCQQDDGGSVCPMLDCRSRR
ncbi:MAG: RNA-dependent RNA polymerase [Guiyang permutotetra-like virus 2]|nr:MAG: RNA-dependent RNA polymerase [Guiyang permutotetra-like virus 2]